MSENTITYDEFIKKAVDAFLGWHLPHNFSPDAGIVFDPLYNKGTPYQNRHDPVGTNLLDADQARDMFEACIPERVFVEATTENAALKARVAELEAQMPVWVKGYPPKDGEYVVMTNRDGERDLNIDFCMDGEWNDPAVFAYLSNVPKYKP